MEKFAAETGAGSVSFAKGFPHSGQNFEPSGTCAPQFVQYISITSFLFFASMFRITLSGDGFKEKFVEK